MAERGKYKTRQQEVILGCLKKQKTAFSYGNQFMECLEKDNITVGYTTVYRALERLEEEGKLLNFLQKMEPKQDIVSQRKKY